MTILLIILLILLVIYFWYQNRKLKVSGSSSGDNSVIFDSEADLIADRDSAIRSKNETEAENLSLSNKLKLKNQEVSRKEQQIETLKKEASQKEIALNKKIKELKNNYSKKSQQLDQADLENNKLVEQINQHEEQLRKINLLFDKDANTYEEIDFNGLYELLTNIAKERNWKV